MESERRMKCDKLVQKIKCVCAAQKTQQTETDDVAVRWREVESDKQQIATEGEFTPVILKGKPKRILEMFRCIMKKEEHFS